MWLKVQIVPDVLAHAGEDADKAVCFAFIAAWCDAGNEQALAVWTKSAGVQLVVFRDE